MFENIKLIMMDIDGTISDDNRQWPEEVKEALTILHNHGILLGLASGRPAMQLKRNAEMKGYPFEFDVIIGQNGMEIWDNQTKVFTELYKLQPSWLREIYDLMEPFHINPFMYRGIDGWTMKIDNDVKANAKRNIIHFEEAKDADEFCAEPNFKVMYRMEEELMPKVMEVVNAHPSPYYRAFRTQSTMLEFMDIRADKKVGVEKICELKGISLEDTMGFGDMSNDNGMLEVCGYSVCMKNGAEDTKAIADEITEKTNNEAGLADWLYRKIITPRNWN